MFNKLNFAEVTEKTVKFIVVICDHSKNSGLSLAVNHLSFVCL